MKINILESEWTIEYCNADADPQLEGGRSRKENEQIREKMKNVPTDESMVLVAIGQYIGEGVNYPRFDTMMLVPPPHSHCLAGERGTVFRKASQGFCCY